MIKGFQRLILPGILLIVLGFGTIRLSESPTVWGDEGMIIELAINLVQHGAIKTQIAPNEFISAAFVTTGFPVIYPVAASFKIFGIGLLQARAVMVVYLLLCVAALFVLVKRLFGMRNATYAALLIATFPPFYGNGKNVLGEVPGLFFFFLFLLCVHRIETSEQYRRWFYSFAGIAAGLCLVTKPTFLTLLPAIVGAAILLRKKPARDVASLALFAAGIAVPILLWVSTQFLPGDSLKNIFSFYSNPYQLDNVQTVIIQNILRFFKESAPLYLFGLFLLWSISFFSRLWQDFRTKPLPRVISYAEAISYVLVILILIAYLRTPGWHRYFFPAQIIVFLYTPSSLRFILNGAGKLIAQKLQYANPVRFLTHGVSLILSVFIIFQAYLVGFNSWIATTYKSTFTQELTAYFKTIDPNKSIFTYPELIVVLPSGNYYQFVDMNGFTFGKEQLDKIAKNIKDGKDIPDILILTDRAWDARGLAFPLYQEKDRVARYVIAEKKQ